MKTITGIAFFHEKTKVLVDAITKHQIAVINHKDIDVLAAESLVKKKVKAVVNMKPSMSGDFFQEGVKTLLKHNIHVFDAMESNEIGQWVHQRQIVINNKRLFVVYNNKKYDIGPLKGYDKESIQFLEEKAKRNMPNAFKKFCHNSFSYAEKDMKDMLRCWERMETNYSFTNKDILIAVRGVDFQKDLECAKKVVCKNNIITIAVDGAANAMTQMGMAPDYIVGDMDSASDRALRCGAELLVHKGSKGNAPGMGRIEKMGLTASALTFIGLSEDAAIAFALKGGANKIFLVGGHRDMDEYLSKGRKGMGSSLLMRMFGGSKIIDLKGIHYMYDTKLKRNNWTEKLYSSVPFLPNPSSEKEMGDINA